jgi:hypothetical protein
MANFRIARSPLHECKQVCANLFFAIIKLKMSVQGKKCDWFDLGANSRNTVRNAFCVIRGIFNDAIEANIIEVNPAARLGRFTRTAKTVRKDCFESQSGHAKRARSLIRIGGRRQIVK